MSSLQELETRIAALERAVRADSLGANAFSLNAKGEVEENLTGKLHSKGILIPLGFMEGAGPFGPGISEPTEVAWEEPGRGALLASLSGFQYRASVGELFTRLILGARGATTRQLVSLMASATQPPYPEKGELRALCGSYGKKILDLNGESDFAFKGEGGGKPVITIYEALKERQFGVWNVVQLGPHGSEPGEKPPALVMVRTEIENVVSMRFEVRESPAQGALNLGTWQPAAANFREEVHTFAVPAGWEWVCSLNSGAGEAPELHSTYAVFT